MTELHEHRIKRLKMRSMRRGIKEMDIILERFAQGNLTSMSDADLSLYDAMLNENDHDLYQWVTRQVDPPEAYSGLIDSIVCDLPENPR